LRQQALAVYSLLCWPAHLLDNGLSLLLLLLLLLLLVSLLLLLLLLRRLLCCM
jgi:hypothetical protein